MAARDFGTVLNSVGPANYLCHYDSMRNFNNRKFFPMNYRSNYSNKVLIGNWVHDQLNLLPLEPQDPQGHQWSSLYRESYPIKPYSKINPSVTWDRRLENEESNIGRDFRPEISQNFSTTYDLSYNHFPKCFKEIIPRVWRLTKKYHEPRDEYLNNYGNITNYGILKEKQLKWDCDVDVYRHLRGSNYKSDFTAPDPENYKFKKFLVKCPQKGKYNPITWDAL